MGWPRSSEDIPNGTRRKNREKDEHTSAAEDSGNMNYQSFTNSRVTSSSGGIPTQTQYRGFSTSIDHMFMDPANERVDCCALACCGIFQNDRDRYLITGVKPPSCCRRFWIHFVLPCWIFALAMFCAVNIKDPFLNEIFSSGLILMLVGYFIIQYVKGMWKRREIRKDLLWSKYNMLRTGSYWHRSDEDSSADQSLGENPVYHMGQTMDDIRNAHSICGCYASDHDSSGQFEYYSFCARLFRCYTGFCCGALCGCHLQMCGLCAVAQEGRQVEELIHKRYRRLDYVTMQPMIEYYTAIYEARIDEDNDYSSTCFSFWERLSSFSRWVVGILAAVLLVLLAWSLLGFHRHFAFRNYIVFCATLLQAYAVLMVVHWRHVKDISTDALIKYFVSGFCLSTTLSIFFEVVVGLSLRLIMVILMEISGIDAVKSAGYTMMSPGFAMPFAAMQEVGDSSTYRDYLKVYGKDHPVVYTVYLFINAFLLAATVEETCKYFGFRMVEHPDFLSRDELEDAAKVEAGQSDEGADGRSFSQQKRTLESQGAAITVAMISAALGFACCENLVYIFIYGSSSFDVEVVILLARSIFPVHPIAAALQSIRVCERELEKKKNLGLGRIILPGVLFHGIYDFLLMWIDFLWSRNGSYVDDDDDKAIDSEDQSDWLSFALSFVVMIGTLCYFFRTSRDQRDRLQAMDRESTVDQSRLI